METQVVLATLVFPDILDLMENLAPKDHEAVMASLEDPDQGDHLVFPVI